MDTSYSELEPDIVGITCLASGVLPNAAVGRYQGKGGDEQTLLRPIQDTLESGDLLLGDALFPAFFLIAFLQVKGVDLLMGQLGIKKRVTDFRCGKRLGQRDHLVTLHKPKKKPDWMDTATYDATPGNLTVREFKAGGKIMVTTLLCPKKTDKAALKNLYRQRWHVELDIRSIKDTMGIGSLSCKTPDMAVKEIWVYTNIVLNDNLVDQAMRLTGIKTKRELVDFSFRELIPQRQKPVKPSLAGMFAELRELSQQDEEIFPEIARQNRPNPFAEGLG